MANRRNKGQQQDHPHKLRVAAAQMRFAPTMDENLCQIQRLAKQAARKRVDAVLFPECAVTGYAYDFGSLRAAQIRSALVDLSAIAARQRINLLVGSPVFRRRKLYNCLVLFDRAGSVTYCYAKNHLTTDDQAHFTPGDAVALFEVDGVPVTSVICHERRYPELVRLAVMAGAMVLFHPNAGMDSLAVSRRKRHGQDGIAARAFENAIYYVFANSVGPQGDGKWSAGDSKIVAPNEKVLALADNQQPALIAATLDLRNATRVYAQRALQRPAFLAAHWRRVVQQVRRRAREAALDFDLPPRAGSI
jgi:predicted amidohydrolase